ncbi:hypothetical protein KIH39_14520 [Telmatocola sphagniphila]|uniref:Uncharacterized protein n=1 Tax=Telmatocola sphagniphila TaxID=1123043 RepID=A0A8E6B1H3_9BACT|nr:hypothetical protein [Telmatocola sphagniphila]QVL30073.1 hypothetical protein KIH39_14520 [Telmatocola sphagniphila]
MNEVLRNILEFVRYYGSTFALLLTWVTIAWVYWNKRRNWLQKEFVEQVNFSLNYVSEGKLVMRTLAEMHARNVWINDLGVRQVIKAARVTTASQPFIKLDDPEDMGFIYRAVLNVLSEKFAETYLAQQLGLPITSATYFFAITMERYDDIRTLKLRVLLVEERELKTWFAPQLPEGQTIGITAPHYEARLQTLRAMHLLHEKAGEKGAIQLGRVVLGLRN